MSITVQYLDNYIPQSDFTSRQKLCCEKFQLEITWLFVLAIKSTIFHLERRQSTEKYEWWFGALALHSVVSSMQKEQKQLADRNVTALEVRKGTESQQLRTSHVNANTGIFLSKKPKHSIRLSLFLFILILLGVFVPNLMENKLFFPLHLRYGLGIVVWWPLQANDFCLLFGILGPSQFPTQRLPGAI